ncbi:MAG: hypothetical protein Q8K75_07990 [Chlamydiales bacterium]|nr:hypothetical protein [Chlamydiales bacterium]
MGIVSNGKLALQFTTGYMPTQKVLSLRFNHAIKCSESAIRTTCATTAAFAIGFLVPNALGEVWWPEQYNVDSFLNSSAAIRFGSGLFFGCWAFSKTIPKLSHHIHMVINPEEAVYAGLRRDLRALFDDVMRFLIALAVCAVPCYLAVRSIQWIVF